MLMVEMGVDFSDANGVACLWASLDPYILLRQPPNPHLLLRQPLIVPPNPYSYSSSPTPIPNVDNTPKPKTHLWQPIPYQHRKSLNPIPPPTVFRCPIIKQENSTL
ncbi:unnamed protein product [Ilex paraguariensis]|uniref:Uncharacterized protein n=1 Tax=Ilex paraguariensis TaxID=185542 RepID=A0ABC8SWX2_9AQUA